MLLVDGNPLLFRSWWTYDLTTSRGEPTNMIYGTLSILGGLFKKLAMAEGQEPPTVFWDLGKSAYRVAKYPDYKNTPNRKASRERPGYPAGSFESQAVVVKEILTLLGVRQVQVRGVEADDLIAIAALTAPPSHTVVTDDLDMFQLVEQYKLRVYSPKKDAYIGSRDECFRVTGLYPEQILDYKALAGDPSDNIPGVEGVGEKTAIALLTAVKDLPDLYQKLRSEEKLPVGPKIRQRIAESEDLVKLWYDLCQPLDWGMLTPEQQASFLEQWDAAPETNRPALVEALERWELREFLNEFERFVELFNPRPEPPVLFDGPYPKAPAKPMPPPPMPPSAKIEVTVSTSSIPELVVLHEKVVTCDACTLRKECKLPVPGNVGVDSLSPPTVMIVGRNPGATEDKLGRGFVGRSGQRLDNLLAGLDDRGQKVTEKLLDRNRVWITNVAHCYSLSNRPPTEQEWHTCAGLHLREEIRTLKPVLVLSFGSESMTALTGYDDSIMQRAGSCVTGTEANGIVQYAVQDGERRWDPVIPQDCTILLFPHPSAALRTRGAEIKFQQCGKVLEEWLKNQRPTRL